MKLIQDQPGENWHTDDPARLYFASSGCLTEGRQTLQCFVLHNSLNRGGLIEIAFADLEFMAAAMFGKGRGESTKWTGSSYQHAIYTHQRSFSSRAAIVILETHGGGTQGYFIDTLTGFETWSYLARTLTSELLWNVCHDLCRMYDNLRYVECQQTYRLFLQGRLKKRRRHGSSYVAVLPEQKEHASATSAAQLL